MMDVKSEDIHGLVPNQADLGDVGIARALHGPQVGVVG
jgi:hypothetical protein